jgi:pimeloyl-ACP methyl ester carboxylesterase
MEKAKLNGVTLEYEVKGSGEPVLLITGAHMAAGYLPFLSQRGLTDRYRLIRYHKRGLAGSTHTAPPVSFADHAADAAGLLDHLRISHTHVVGHSSGGAIALQLALDRPQTVHTLVLLEPAMLTVPSAAAFFAKAGPSVDAYAAGDHAAAVAIFLSAVSGLDWETCRSVIEEHVPGGVSQAIEDADTFFSIELPALMNWTLTPEQAGTIAQPVLSVLGTRTEPLFVEAAELLRRWLPRVENCTIDGLGHLLHMQRTEPVAHRIVEFLGRHPMNGADIHDDRSSYLGRRPVATSML